MVVGIRWAVCAILPLAVFVPVRGEAAIDYETRFDGADGRLRSELEEVSQLVALADVPPATPAMLERRARDDVPRLTQVMESEGFYDAAIEASVAATDRPDQYEVRVHVVPGDRYSLGDIILRLPDGARPVTAALEAPAATGLQRGQPALAAEIVGAETRIVHLYARHGWPFARITARETVIDTATRTMAVTYDLDPGAPALFGASEISGLARLDPAYVSARLRWHAGDSFDQALVDDTRQTLVTSGLFGSVTVAAIPPVGADGGVPMAVTLTERPIHSVSAGASYDTSLGLEGTLSWEDRDLFGYAEDLTLTAQGGQSDSSLLARFVRPDAFWTNQDFVASASFANQLEEAFRSLNQRVQLGFQEHLTPELTAGWGVSGEHARIDEKIDYRVYTLVGLPLFLRVNTTDDLLSPSRGYRAGLELTPYLRAIGSELTYAQAKLTGSAYQALDPAGTYRIAGQVTLGGSCCAALQAIPKDHRFFAGGGGSVRGFGFQKAGPFDPYDNPIGGRSLLAASLELRAKITDTIGIVPFLDAGSDGPTALPKLDSKLYAGAGIGLRYYTAIGPIRLDLATPINPHPVGDAPIQIYVGLGEAF